MKYEIGFVEPSLLDFVTKNHLHLPNIIFKEIPDYETDQLLQYAALRKQCLGNDIEINVSLKSKFGERESVLKNVYGPIKELEDLFCGYDGTDDLTKASSYPPNIPSHFPTYMRHAIYGYGYKEYVEDIDRSSMYDVQPICITLTPSSMEEFVRRMKDVSEKAEMIDETLSHMVNNVTSYHLTGTSDFNRLVNDFIIDRKLAFASRALRVIKSRKKE